MSAFPPFSKERRAYRHGLSLLVRLLRAHRPCLSSRAAFGRAFHVITGDYHLWFLYMIVGLYLLIPLLRPIAQSETLMRYFLSAGAYLYVSSPSACPVFLLYLRRS